MTNARVDVSEFLSERSVSRFQIRVVVFCSLAIMFDSFDAQSLAFVAPSLSKEWGLAPGALGPVFGAALFGMMVGALAFGALADHFGRKWLVFVGIVVFGLGSIAVTFASDLNELLVVRFLTGLGLGGVLPTAISLTGEYVSKKRRALTIMLMFALAAFGVAMGALVSSMLIPTHGWRSVLWLGGLAPLALAVAVIVGLPESLSFLVAKRADSAKVRAILSKIDPTVQLPADVTFALEEEHGSGIHGNGVLVFHLFRNGRAWVTSLLWVVFFMSLLEFYFMQLWLPTLIHEAGLGVEAAVAVSSVLQVGGAFGMIVLGLGVDRIGFYKVLVPTYLLACLVIVAVGWAGASLILLVPAVFLTGACVIGGQVGINALAANFYPTFIRSTGVGWALGIGRIGSIVGPVVGGMMLALHWSAQALLYASAIPPLCSAIMLVIIAQANNQYTRNDGSDKAGLSTYPMEVPQANG
jgi:MFS transporter, AAHS family, 4-hydroxybenzoate transporter